MMIKLCKYELVGTFHTKSTNEDTYVVLLDGSEREGILHIMSKLYGFTGKELELVSLGIYQKPTHPITRVTRYVGGMIATGGVNLLHNTLEEAKEFYHNNEADSTLIHQSNYSIGLTGVQELSYD